MTTRRQHVLALAGSLRDGSYNRRLVAASATLAPPGMAIEQYPGLRLIPIFLGDEAIPDVPDAVSDLCQCVRQSDGLLIATPEYNQSFPGVLKNALDWLSVAPGLPLDGKAVAIMGATTGAWGTRYAQAALRHVLTATGALVMPSPSVFLKEAANIFDTRGDLRDEHARASVRALLDALSRWIAVTRELNETVEKVA